MISFKMVAKTLTFVNFVLYFLEVFNAVEQVISEDRTIVEKGVQRTKA